MAYFVVYRTDTGEAVSLGTVVADPLPAGLAVADIGAPLTRGQRWHAATLTVIEVPEVPSRAAVLERARRTR